MTYFRSLVGAPAPSHLTLAASTAFPVGRRQSRALVKLHELDQYDDAELVRKKTAAMFAGFITRVQPEDQLMGEGLPDENGIALAGLEPGTMQILEAGEDIKFSQPANHIAQPGSLMLAHIAYRCIIYLSAIAVSLYSEEVLAIESLEPFDYGFVDVLYRRDIELLQHHLNHSVLCVGHPEAYVSLAVNIISVINRIFYARGEVSLQA